MTTDVIKHSGCLLCFWDYSWYKSSQTLYLMYCLCVLYQVIVLAVNILNLLTDQGSSHIPQVSRLISHDDALLLFN